MEPTLENVIEMLQDVNEDADYENCTTLVDDRVLTSFDILSIISEIDATFDVAVPAKDIVPANFNSAEAIRALIERLLEED
ncbi:MAG: acyl carrier protein [Eggerthellaceae bacterium]|nr:acyl carrier protein [Eggerthellaceae bacterium]